MKKLTQAQLQEKFETAVANANHPEIASRLAAWSYDEAARTADLAFLAEVREARATQQREITQARAAQQTKVQARKAARARVVVFQRFLRLADRRNPGISIPSTLGMQHIPQAEAKFLDYTFSLLDRVAAQADIATALAKMGYDQTRLDGLRSLLDSVRQASVVQIKEQGEAEQATAAYTALIEQMRITYSYLKTISKEALKDAPQLLEIMGIQVSS